jgi:hypothetical protein
MKCSDVTSAGQNPWNSRSVVASASLAAITLVVCGILAILVNYQVVTLPSQLSVTNLLIAGASGAVFFTLLSLAIKYCCCRPPKKVQDKGDTHTPEGTGKKREEPGHTNLSPDGSGNTGAKGSASAANAFNILPGVRKNPLSTSN